MALVETFALRPKTKAFAHNIVFPPGKTFDRLDDFFVLGKDDAEPHVPPKGRVQDGISMAKFATMDYFAAFGGIPVFTQKFKEEFEVLLSAEMSFHSCAIECEGSQNTLYIGKILNRLELVNHEKSQTFAESRRLIPTYINTSFARDFFIARDSEPRCAHVFRASKNFVDLVKTKKLKIDFETSLTA